jgi:hypothetical protein
MRWSVWGNGMRTHRPASYSAPAIGESSQWMLMSPSNGRWGSGRTILASTCASTLCSAVRKCKCVHVCEGKGYRVLPREHSTWPSSAPKESSRGRASRKPRPSRRAFWSSAAKKNSFSGIEGDGGRIVVDGPDALSSRLQHCSPFAAARLAYGASLRWPALAEPRWRITPETTSISLTVIRRVSSPSAPALPSASATRTPTPPRTIRNTILTMTSNALALPPHPCAQVPLQPTPRPHSCSTSLSPLELTTPTSPSRAHPIRILPHLFLHTLDDTLIPNTQAPCSRLERHAPPALPTTSALRPWPVLFWSCTAPCDAPAVPPRTPLVLLCATHARMARRYGMELCAAAQRRRYDPAYIWE